MEVYGNPEAALSSGTARKSRSNDDFKCISLWTL